MTPTGTPSQPRYDLAHFQGRDALVAALQEALRDEHALIVQLMGHGYRLRDDQALGTMESIGRQDMRHFKWLAETIVSLGETPTLARSPVSLAPAAPGVWLAADVAAIEARMARYQETIESLDPHVLAGPIAEVRGLLVRIVSDKVYHREKVLKLLARFSGDEASAAAGPALDAEDATTHGFLDFAIGHEYEVILQYLHHAFLLEDQWASRQLEDVAIEEMRHLGWLSEALSDRGGTPLWEATRLELDHDAVRMLELDQAREIEVEADYAQMTAAMQDPVIKRLFDRIGHHERYHAGTLGRLVERLKAQALETPRLTPPPVFPPVAPLKASGCPYTVGSLFGVPQNQPS